MEAALDGVSQAAGYHKGKPKAAESTEELVEEIAEDKQDFGPSSTEQLVQQLALGKASWDDGSSISKKHLATLQGGRNPALVESNALAAIRKTQRAALAVQSARRSVMRLQELG